MEPRIKLNHNTELYRVVVIKYCTLFNLNFRYNTHYDTDDAISMGYPYFSYHMYIVLRT